MEIHPVSQMARKEAVVEVKGLTRATHVLFGVFQIDRVAAITPR